MDMPYLLRRTASFDSLTERVAESDGPFDHIGIHAPAVPVLGVDGVATEISNSPQQVLVTSPDREENPGREQNPGREEAPGRQQNPVGGENPIMEEAVVGKERQGAKTRSQLKNFLLETLKVAYMVMWRYFFNLLKHTATTFRVQRHSHDSVCSTLTAPTFQNDTEDLGSLHSMYTEAASPVEDAQEVSSAFPLLKLPTEVVVEVMLHLPAPSLYCLRQTSTRLMKLFDTHHFNMFHREPESPGNHKRLDVSLLTFAQRNDVANALHHDMYCTACLAAEDCGTIDKRLETLRSLQFCHGCDVLHARALFPEDSAAYGLAPDQQVCIGRLQRVTVCNHILARSLSWQDISHFPYIVPGKACEIACTRRSHQPQAKCGRFWTTGSAFPRFFAADPDENWVQHIGYGWDLPLLDLERRSDHTVTAIQESLSKLVVEALHNHNHRLCPHISADREIRKFVQSGICNCFAKHKICQLGMKAPWPKGCECGRQVTLECRICGAVYMWYLAMGQVILSLRYSWYVQKPTGFGWLGLLGFQIKFSSRDNQHVLWCDTPDCRTNKKRRWEALVKENIRREYFEGLAVGYFGDDYQDYDSTDDDGTFDYKQMETASEEGSFQSW
ncbi:hypothetical protein H634G_09577 [Metarhizium anisopliae BRIP 53293]|uniref:F-box domain-containing protein n=1 Tax=Metarhizium anisopliae BRIP 53293 TaxID=1291518 RepID=A0A0D9NMV5_METAN|nr:hypothetical protein H634G_09577 [Metarhizium anisopliae BRIP 53293]KJK88548.1 hypothetical protein H633G_07583 [Metarhizium anisopliae BRIP 53284]